MKFTGKLILALFCFALLALPCSALTIKIASLAPEGSPWNNALHKLSADWSRISGGRLTMRIYPGGIAGGEFDMIRKIRINQLQAAALTGIGLGFISTDVILVQLPFFVRDDRELDYLLEKMRPTFDRILQEKGFRLLEFTNTGWAVFFSKEPIITPGDLKKQKMFTMAGHSKLDMAWKAMGFHIIPIPATEVIPALQSGMVEAFLTTPLTAAAMQWFGLAPYMTDLRFAPMTGGIIISERVWLRIPDEIKPELLAATRRIAEDLEEKTGELEEEAIEVMRNNGLKINHIPEQAIEDWKELVREGFSMLIGDVFSQEIYEEAKGHLEEYRRNNAR